MELIDTNVHLHRWPFRRLRLDDTGILVRKLTQLGVSEAWVGSYDALLHRDVAAVNQRLAEECTRFPMLNPFGTVNLSLPDWQEDLRRCAEEYKMRGIRLYPNYHGYELTDDRFRRLLTLATERGLIVQIAVMMEEERTQHPLVRMPHVNTAPLIDMLKRLPRARVVLQNCFRAVRGGLLLKLVATERVWFDTSTIEGMAGIKRIMGQVPVRKLVFGTHSPHYIPESALLKLKESDLSKTESIAIRSGNAKGLIP